MQFLLKEDFFLNEAIVAKGTVVGDGTTIPWRDRYNRPIAPSPEHMEGVDEEGKEEIERMRKAKGLPEPLEAPPEPTFKPEALRGMATHKKVQTLGMQKEK